MNKLFILSGASGAGKSTLLNRLVKDGYCIPAKKYTERKRFNSTDDVFTVEDISDPKLQCDLIYCMYDNKYGFNTRELSKQLQEGNLILTTNNELVIKELKKIFSQHVVVIYIVSDIDKSLLRKIYMKRHGFPSIKNLAPEIIAELQKSKESLLCDDGEKFIQCIEKINALLDDVALRENEFTLRLDSIINREKVYTTNIFMYDYTVLNLYSHDMSTIHATNSAFEQLRQIINKETESKNE